MDQRAEQSNIVNFPLPQSSAGTTIIVQSPVYLDRRLLGNGLAPSIVNAIRLNVGVRF